jgi:hypothetical protein
MSQHAWPVQTAQGGEAGLGVVLDVGCGWLCDAAHSRHALQLRLDGSVSLSL